VTPAPRAPVATAGAAPAAPRPDRAGRAGRAGWAHRGLALGVLAVWLLPVFVLVTTSLNPPDRSATRGLLPTPVSLASYGRVLSADGDWRASLLDTAGLALCVTVLVVGLAVLAAFGLGQWATRPDGPSSPRDRSGTAVLLAAAAVIPIQVIAGPVTDTLARVGLAALLPGLVLVHVALGLPFALLVLRGALDRDVTAWLKAQRIAGQSRWRTLAGFARRASVRSAVIAVAVIEFALVWNDLVVGLLFGAPDVVPLGPLVLGESRQFVTNSAPLAAISVVGSLVPLVLVVRARRHVLDAVFRQGLR
jgi:alpha-glucoside transport system permease protein